MNVYLPNLRLPSEYQEVEYIQSSWTQYINTGVTVNSENRVFRLKYILYKWHWINTVFWTFKQNSESDTHTRFSRTNIKHKW